MLVRTKSIKEMILYITVLCGPVLRFAAVLAWGTGRPFLVSPKGGKF